MGHIDRSVFISYRRTNYFMALAIYQHLTSHGYDVFIDLKGLAGGDFESAILDNIRTRAHFVVVLTPSALNGCDNPTDWLRREIETALECQRNIVPLTFEGFDFKRPELAGVLTGRLGDVKHYNALWVPETYFDAAMDRLRKYLDVPLDTVRHPASRAAQQMSITQQTAAHSAPPVQQSDLSAERWFERGYQASDIDEQIRCYTEAIRLNPDNRYAFFNRASARSQKGDLQGALQDYNQVMELDPSLTTTQTEALTRGTYLMRGDLRSKLGDLQGALDDREALTRLVPNASNIVARGALKQKIGDIDGALNDCEEAIRLDPQNSMAFFYRAGVRKDRGDARSARLDYDEAIRLNPRFAEAFANRARLREDAGDLDGALQDHSDGIRFKPDMAQLYENRAGTYLSMGDVDRALPDYDEAIRLDANSAHVYVIRGLLRHNKGDIAGALQDFDQAIQLRPDYVEARKHRGALRAETGDVAGAFEDFDEGIRLQPDWELFKRRGVLRLDQGDANGALNDFEAAIDLDPNEVSLFVNRGNARNVIGDLKGARADYRKYFDLIGWDPTQGVELIEYLVKNRKQLDVSGYKPGT